MYRSSAKRLSALVVSVAAGFFLVSPALFGADKVEKKTTAKIITNPFISVKTGISQPLRSMNLPRPRPGETRREIPNRRGPNAGITPTHKVHDPAMQIRTGGGIPGPTVSFEGIDDSICFCQPADPNAAVGPNNVGQYVNVAFEIWDKDGNSQTGGAVLGNAFWQGFGGACEQNNSGDPIVLYDQLADRWVWSQFALFTSTGNHQCFAVSTSGDPLDTYYLYDFLYSTTDLNDYPKISVWPDAYYMTVRNFGSNFTMTVTAFDRSAMLSGVAASGIRVDLNNPNFDGLLAATLDGSTPPPGYGPLGGQPVPSNVLAGMGHPDADGSPTPRIHLYYFHPDFVTPASSTFTGPLDLDVDVYNFVPQFSGVPQPPPGGALEANGWIQYRLPYRNFGDHESLIIEHDVFDDAGRVVPRWYELRDPYGTPTVFQQGTYAPADGIARWMGSAALDASNDIAIGFSVTDTSTVYPGIRWAGRLPGDTPGTLGQGEAELIPGDVAFGGFRWGDYSSLAIDPVDQCTFWYTTMYTPASAGGDWSTRIGSFKFPSCTLGPSGILEGTVTDGTNPLAGAKVKAGAASANTNAAGHYSFTLPVGAYDMTASKYGYFPVAASGVSVTDGGDTVQDFVLAPAPVVSVNGVVKDGSGGGWPLYAKVKVTAPGAPTFQTYTDPVTGYYSFTLVAGGTYNFVVTAVSPGYAPGGGPVPLGLSGPATPGGVVKNWDLFADALNCNAPGYSLAVSGLYQDFSSGVLPPGWSYTNDSTDGGLTWIIFSGGDPCGQFPGNLTGGSGPYAIVNSNCDGFVTDITDLITPSVDLSGTTDPIIRFNTDYDDCCGSVADVDVSINGGTSWSNVFEWAGVSDRGPKIEQYSIPSAVGQSDVKVRFHFNGFWAWWWQVDNVLVGEAGCLPGAGGLVVGNVRDANTGAGLNGATVKNLPDDLSTTTFATPGDPNQDDGFYILFAQSGNQPFEASLSLYQSQPKSTLVVPGGAQRLDFSLGSGRLAGNPSALSARVDPGQGANQTLTLTNSGSAPASFTILEINAPAANSATHGFASEALRQQALARLPKNAKGVAEGRETTTRNIPPMPNAPEPGRTLSQGDVIASYPSGIAYGWGVATSGVNFWISNLAVVGGDDKDYEYNGGDGSLTGNTIDDTWVSVFGADGTFNIRTGMMWRVNVGGDDCLYELDPVNKVSTGNKICGSPWTSISQRGVAYDAAGDTYFVGGWNEGVIYHIDGSGTVLDSAFVGLSISALAYNAQNGHLLVMQNFGGGDDITVLDAFNNYATLGSYPVLDNGNPAFTPFGQAGMEFDCLGNLWVIDQNTQTIYEVQTDENALCSLDIPWLTENPTEGTVGTPAGATNPFPVAVTFDSTGLLPGLRQAQLLIQTDTPYQLPVVPVNLTVRFLDVPDANQFQAFIYGAAGAGVMNGGPPSCGTDDFHFCPNGVVTRADMAGYIFRAVHGRNTPPPVYQNIFADVHFNDYNSFYIQGIFNDGITAGCGDGNYCPTDANTRAQMSVFIWKGEHGSTAPPACTGVFADVACPGGFAVDYIEGLASEGVTAGCGGGNFCPNANITNGQMAVFLVKGFKIPHL